MTVRGLDCRGEGGEVGDVDRQSEAAGQSRGQSLQRIGASRHQRHPGTLGGERSGGAQADARGRSGDDESPIRDLHEAQSAIGVAG